MRKLLVAAIVLLITSPAFAAIQNVKVSGDIQTTFVDRQDFSFGILESGTPTGLVSQRLFAEQTRLRVDADLTDNVSTTVRLINETAWGLPAGDTGSVGSGTQGLKGVDLDLAYVTLKSFLYSPLTLTVGRQEFFFGNGLIIGGGPNNSTSGHFTGVANDLSEIDSLDGIKAVLDYKPLTLSFIYYKNAQGVPSLTGAYDSNGESSDVYGVNANYQLGDAYNTVLEAYLFSRVDGNNILGTGQDKGNTLYVPGLRASTNPVKGLNVQGELAWEGGNNVVTTGAGTTLSPYKEEAEHRNAIAAQLLTTYSLPVLEKYKPAVNASYTYASGDKNSDQNYDSSAIKSAKVFSAWDQFGKNQNSGTIYSALFPLSNLNIFALGASASPLQDVTTAFTWSSLWAADKFGDQNPLVLYQPNQSNGSASPNALYAGDGISGKKGLGNEYDINIGYNYTEDVSFGVSLGWFAPGNAFADSNRNTASQAIADLRVAF